ncbi:hypothetical protein [Paenibacillus sp. Z6-24]
MKKGTFPINTILKIYYLIMAVAVIALIIGKERWLEGAGGTQAAMWLYYGAVTVGILILVPALVMAWFWLRRWMTTYKVEPGLQKVLLIITIPMMLVIGYMLELVFIMIFIGLGGSS